MTGRACPVLTTARLTLSAHAAADFDDVLAMWSNPEVVRHMGGVPARGPEVWDRLLKYAGLWPLMGYGYWAVRERESGRYVGDIGLAEFRREITPSIIGLPEAGWSLMPWAHGRGYAHEATAAMYAWADATLAGRTVCMIAPANAPSLALAARLGFAACGETLYKDRPVVLLERPGPRPPA